MDKSGNLVIIENKLDDSGKDVTWQSLKYASYCSGLTKENIIKKSTLAIASSEPFSNEFKINPQILSSIFKIFLSANSDFLKIK